MKMTMTMSTLLGTAAVCFTAAIAGDVFTGENMDEPFTIHGRLSFYNGTPSARIWIVGSTRMLGVLPDEDLDALGLPPRISRLLGDESGIFAKQIYADFHVQPMAPDKKGHMRPVKMLGAKNIVVTQGDKVILNEKTKKQKKSLQAVPQ